MYNDFEQNTNENEIYQITPVIVTAGKKKKKFQFKKVTAFSLALLLGAGITFGAMSAAMPSMIRKELSKNPTMYNDKNVAAKPSMTTEQAGVKKMGVDKQLLSVVEIAKKVGPTVVGINTKVKAMSIFGTEQMGEGSGSGIILTQDGYIVTNNHVIDGASEIKVVLSDGKTYPADVTGADARTDLAVLKIKADNLPYATLGNSEDLQVGELAIAIGNPLGNELAGSLTGGYISALNRSITVDDKQFNLIQTDAAINPGNSGGALVNNYGEVIGINSVKMSASDVEGIGFAIPIDGAKPIIEDLKSSGYVKGRPVIGISGRTVSPEDSKYYSLPIGVYVYQVTPYSAAEKAGLRAGDVITKFDKKEVKTIEELNETKEKFKVGDTVAVTYIREGKPYDTTLKLTEEKPISQLD